MSGNVTIKDRGAGDLLKRVRDLARGRSVRVGILADEPKDEEKPGQRGKHSKNARTRAKVAKRSAESVAGGKRKYSLLEVAIVHEFGGVHVPQRSFIRATVDEKRAEIVKLQVALAKNVLLGKITADQALSQLGAKVASWCQARIVAGIAPPLAASTLRRKKNKTTPLILTGQLRSSITFAVGAAA